jgi:aminoglycoside N3'-acetyltransferase
MPIPVTTETDMREHVAALGLQRGTDVVVHSRLLAFGRSPAPASVYRVLRDAIGDEATLVVPTYTFDTSPARPYDPGRSPATNMGAFSEYVRTLPGAVRSLSPIHNHAAVGPRAALMLEAPATSSLGPGTDFEVLLRAGFSLVLLGCEFNQGCTYLHHVEAMVGVPYRRWIEVDRVLRDTATSKEESIKVRYYARVSEDLRSNFDVVEAPLAARGALRSARATLGRSFLVTLADLDACARDMLAVDPYALVAAGG